MRSRNPQKRRCSHAHVLEEDFKKEPQDKKFLEQWQKIQETKKNGDVRGYEVLLFGMMEQWKQEYRKAAEDR